MVPQRPDALMPQRMHQREVHARASELSSSWYRHVTFASTLYASIFRDRLVNGIGFNPDPKP